MCFASHATRPDDAAQRLEQKNRGYGDSKIEFYESKSDTQEFLDGKFKDIIGSWSECFFLLQAMPGL